MPISRSGGLARPCHGTSAASAARRLLVGVAAGALVMGMGAVSAAPAMLSPPGAAGRSGSPMFFGASGGSAVKRLAHEVNARLALHSYGQLQGSVPEGRLINMAPNIPWSTITASKPGSGVYRDIARWADAIKSRPGTILFTFSHEPEGATSQAEHLGTAPQFIRAFRKVRHVFLTRGAHNVEFTWNMTSNSFRVPPSDPRYAAKWYPGNKYVDNVASAAYNWYDCGEGAGQWLSLADRASAPLAFAKKHHKELVLAEWASQQDPRRASWLRSAHQWLQRQESDIRAAFYYQTSTPRAGCTWKLSQPRDLKAFGNMARDL